MCQKGSIVVEKWGCLFDSSSCIEQLFPLIGKFYADVKTIMALHKADNLVGEMMQVDDDLVESGSF